MNNTSHTQGGYKGADRVFSGVQPTGQLHLGNYLGAIKKFVPLQEVHDCLFCVVDLHAVTTDYDPKALAASTREIAAGYLAAGIDPQKAIIFPQSAVTTHAELTWLFNCVARMGWVERMTQFKDKAGKDKQRVSVGLFDYPVLQAADILAYKATHVPVGEDQKQHLELSRDIADKFNRDIGAKAGEAHFFPLPEPLIDGPGARIMSLKDGTKKMSKSDPSDLSRINLLDDRDTIARKIKKAKTDPEPMPEAEADLSARPEVENLIGIYAVLNGQDVADVIEEFAGQGLGQFKPKLAELAVEKLAPLSERFHSLMSDKGELDRILKEGAARAEAISRPIMDETYKLMGFWGH